MTKKNYEAFATAQVVVGTTATLISAARDGTDDVTIVNFGTTQVFIGNANVTTGTGFPLPGVVGASLTIPATTAIYGIVASGTQPVAVMSTY
jgi:hypothetical protein